jgi:hypothetical protein
MNTILTSSAPKALARSAFHLPASASRFGQGFLHYLASAPRDDDPERCDPSPIPQPLRFLDAVPAMYEKSAVEATLMQPSPESLSGSLGDMISHAARPRTQTLRQI